jgi:hypothetical protein
MLRAFLIIALVIVAGGLAWEFVPLQVAVWDGGFDLAVNVSSTAGTLAAVRCEACSRREEAEFALEHPLSPESHSWWSAVSDPFDGKTIMVRVPLSGKDSPCGRELSRFQFRYLAVMGQLQNGRHFGKLVEIPDSRVSREVSVSLP